MVSYTANQPCFFRFSPFSKISQKKRVPPPKDSLFTPATAGNTKPKMRESSHCKCHPRECGEYTFRGKAKSPEIGSPPLTQGIYCIRGSQSRSRPWMQKAIGETSYGGQDAFPVLHDRIIPHTAFPRFPYGKSTSFSPKFLISFSFFDDAGRKVPLLAKFPTFGPEAPGDLCSYRQLSYTFSNLLRQQKRHLRSMSCPASAPKRKDDMEGLSSMTI